MSGPPAPGVIPVTPAHPPSTRAIAGYFLRLGALGFGGPVALANYMRADLVERRSWLTPAEYDEGLAIATACPGPLAYQLGIYCGYVLRGLRGAVAAALAFATAPFFIVVALAYAYAHFAGAWEVRALFYGVGPVVVALIVKACWNLALKTMRTDLPAWLFAAAACAVTLVVQRELTALFLAAGMLGILVFGLRARRRPLNEGPTGAVAATSPAGSAETLRGGDADALRRTDARPSGPSAIVPFVRAATSAKVAVSLKLFLFFFRTGLLVFGSGLVIVPFLKAYVVDQYHWLNQQQFVDSVAIGMMTPGPVVITATFVGFLLNGFGGALAATLGVFAPPFLFTALGTPLLRRYRSNAWLQGFVRGVTAAVVGVLVGTSYLVGRSVITDAVTVIVALAALVLAVLARRVPDPAIVLGGVIVGLVAYHA